MIIHLYLKINESPCFVNLPDGSKSFCERMVLHEKYKNVGQMLTWNDIVVIKMDKPIMIHNKKTVGKLYFLIAIAYTTDKRSLGSKDH